MERREEPKSPRVPDRASTTAVAPPDGAIRRRRPAHTDRSEQPLPFGVPVNFLPTPRQQQQAKILSQEKQWEKDYGSPLLSLWLESRKLQDEPGERCYPGETRELTSVNLRIAAQLLKGVWKPFVSIFWGTDKIRIAAFIATRFVQGFLPAGR